MPPTRARTVLSTGAALTAFAANSLLCRAALGHAAIDPASFSTIRLAAGAATLLLITLSTRRGAVGLGGSWGSATLLALYAIPFSFAYVGLGAGTGALILFGAVQATMLIAALAAGERPHVVQWSGLILALGGLVYLVMPGLAAPSPLGCALMVIAGVAWGVYSLRGRGAPDPLAETAGNFARSVPLAIGVSVAAAPHVALSVEGALLAAISGALASGLGYVVWYAALSGLSATRAASVQLTVPVLAAAGGVLFLSERITLRLIVAAFLILGGVALALTRTERRRRRQHPLGARPQPEPAERR
jgi:drug/metabolite transporter (DMT)-like permease